MHVVGLHAHIFALLCSLACGCCTASDMVAQNPRRQSSPPVLWGGSGCEERFALHHAYSLYFCSVFAPWAPPRAEASRAMEGARGTAWHAVHRRWHQHLRRRPSPCLTHARPMARICSGVQHPHPGLVLPPPVLLSFYPHTAWRPAVRIISRTFDGGTGDELRCALHAPPPPPLTRRRAEVWTIRQVQAPGACSAC